MRYPTLTSTIPASLAVVAVPSFGWNHVKAAEMLDGWVEEAGDGGMSSIAQIMEQSHNPQTLADIIDGCASTKNIYNPSQTAKIADAVGMRRVE